MVSKINIIHQISRNSRRYHYVQLPYRIIQSYILNFFKSFATQRILISKKIAGVASATSSALAWIWTTWYWHSATLWIIRMALHHVWWHSTSLHIRWHTSSLHVWWHTSSLHIWRHASSLVRTWAAWMSTSRMTTSTSWILSMTLTTSFFHCLTSECSL